MILYTIHHITLYIIFVYTMLYYINGLKLLLMVNKIVYKQISCIETVLAHRTTDFETSTPDL